MAHIKQKTEGVYTVVISGGYEENLSDHPSIVQHPELFEVVEGDPPSNCQFLNYSVDE